LAQRSLHEPDASTNERQHSGAPGELESGFRDGSDHEYELGNERRRRARCRQQWWVVLHSVPKPCSLATAETPEQSFTYLRVLLGIVRVCELRGWVH
jgi:hypothetical protein